MKEAAHALKGFSVSKARKVQMLLSKKIARQDGLPKNIRLVAGVDVSYAGEKSIGAVAVMSYASRELLEFQTSTCTTKFPYIPTLLSFREIPPAIAAIRKLKAQPDVFLVDAHGLAHPYRFGFACHLGLALGKPTIGVAKSRLIGEILEKGKNVFLVHDEEIVGEVVTTRKGAKPVFVSIGHQVSLETAAAIVKNCIHKSRIPEPIRVAHNLALKRSRQRLNVLQKT